MNDRLLGLLGIARRAGKLAMGHDMAIESLLHGKSHLVLVSSTSSARLLAEFQRAAATLAAPPPVLRIPYPMERLHQAVGYKAGVLSVEDAGFAEKMRALIDQLEKEIQSAD